MKQLFYRQTAVTILITSSICLSLLASTFGQWQYVLSADISEHSPNDSVQTLSTPALIDQAVANGTITASERLLYLAYALYQADSLPDRFQSSVGWYGTQYVRELARAWNSNTLSRSSRAQLQPLITLAATVCDEEDGALSKESENFYFSYDDNIQGGLTIDDYIASMEASYAFSVNSYGWAKPPYCTDGVGECTETNPWGKFPVQVSPITSALAYVTIGGIYNGLVEDNPNTATIETAALASCMVMGSNLTEDPSEARAILDATTSHEFIHAIQNAYGDPAPEEDAMWYESGAAYMEDEAYDESNDNYQYLWPHFTSCLGEYPAGGDAVPEYSNWLFFRYAAEHNGGTNVAGGGEDVKQAFWANVGTGQGALTAYNGALETKGSNLPTTYHNYAIASRFMQSCPTASPYCYEEAAAYVEAQVDEPIEDHGRVQEIGGSYDGSLQNHYALNWVNMPFSGSYTIHFDNTTAGGQFNVSIVAQTASGLDLQPMGEIIGGNSSKTLNYTAPNGATSVVAVITNQEQLEDNPSSCTSNAYRIRTEANTTEDPTPVPTQAPAVPTNTPTAPSTTQDSFFPIINR